MQRNLCEEKHGTRCNARGQKDAKQFQKSTGNANLYGEIWYCTPSSENGMQSPSRPLAPAALPAMVPSRAPVVRAPALARIVVVAGLGARLLLLPLVAVFAGMDSVRAPEMRVQRVLRRIAALADATCTAMLAATNQCKPLHIAMSQPRFLASISLPGLVVFVHRIIRRILWLV